MEDEKSTRLERLQAAQDRLLRYAHFRLGEEMTKAQLGVDAVPLRVLRDGVALEDARAGALTTIRFSFEPHNFVPYLGTVCIDFPDSFRFYNPSTGWGFGGIKKTSAPS